MLLTRKKKKSPYRVDLSALQAVCAANYLGLSKLFPGMRDQSLRKVLLGGDESVQLEVLESSRYTTLLDMEQRGTAIAHVPPRRCQVRVYHDVCLAEVVAWGSVRRLCGRYRYPNRDMHQEDEKWQVNRFLGEWIEHCLEQGRAEFRRGQDTFAADCGTGQ